MSGLVFWQKPGENYVRIGEFITACRELIPVGGGFTHYETTATVKRHGRTETEPVWSLREVVPRGQ